MKPPQKRPPQSMLELSPETRRFLDNLSKEDIETLEVGLPLIRMGVAFGKVAKWIFVTLIGLAVGAGMLWDSTAKILSWFKPNGG